VRKLRNEWRRIEKINIRKDRIIGIKRYCVYSSIVIALDTL
jgi:hypothetical protein